MKKITILLVAVLSLAACGDFTSSDNKDDSSSIDSATVYITETGSKYHLSGCQYLAHSKVPISLSEAKRLGYEPCSVCKPPRSMAAERRERSAYAASVEEGKKASSFPDRSFIVAASTYAPVSVDATTELSFR
jgi:hypothetical protein